MTEDKPGITNDSMPGKGRKHAHQSNRSSPSAYPTTFLDSTPPRAPNHRPRKPKYEPPLLSLPRSPACSFDSRTSLESHELSLPRSLSSITSRSDSIAETKLCFSPIFGLLRRKLSEPSLEYKNSAIHQSSIISREVPRSSDHENMVDSLQFHLSLDADTLQDTKNDTDMELHPALT